ncbi:flagellar filament capping protein FliD [Pseudomonas sp. NFX224]|uniref:flagellar filament capping protein FliD n=1 Tax=Pseudomonas sp. NFX224 TaxID=3402862 RepID=UPI003AFB0679
MASIILPGTGLGSGLDTSSIITALVDADKAAKQSQIDRQTKVNTAALSGVGQLKSVLAAYQAALDKLNSTTTPAFLGFAATSSNEASVKATATNSAVSGSYEIAVQSLATSSKVATSSLTAAQASAIPAGSLEITQGTNVYTVDISATSTLQEVRDAVNSKLQASGISANIINDSSGSRLVFGSTVTGEGSDISVAASAADGSTDLDFLNIDGKKLISDTGGAGAISALAADAKFTVDGLALTSAKNTVSNAISGLSFDLVAAGGKSTVTVATNTTGLKTSLQSFVDAYNNLVKTIGTLTTNTADEDGNLTVAAALSGDSTPRSILAAVRSELATSTSSGKLTVLSQLGIATQRDGTLAFDSTTFTAALEDKKLGGEIQSLFLGDDGLLARMSSAIEPYTDTIDGILTSKTANLNLQKSKLSDDQEALDRRIETLTAVLTKKYNAMDLLVGQLKATASNITSMFEAMNAQKSSS